MIMRCEQVLLRHQSCRAASQSLPVAPASLRAPWEASKHAEARSSVVALYLQKHACRAVCSSALVHAG